jgi:hypothetical protein
VKAVSKIFEALKQAELLRAKRNDTNTVGTFDAGYTDRRMTSRIYVRIPLFIYGHTSVGEPFHEKTYTIAVNGAGGLILMSRGVQPGQRLVVTNEGNDQTQECIVVSVQPYGGHIALKFPTPTPQFWRDLEIGKSPALP